MSVQLLPPEHVGLLAAYYKLYINKEVEADALAAKLAQANIDSVASCSPEATAGEGPATQLLEGSGRWAAHYVRNHPKVPIGPFACHVLAYEYHSSRHPQWTGSDAYWVLARITHYLLSQFPGFNKDRWIWTDTKGEP